MPPPVVPDTTSPAALQEASILQGIGEYVGQIGQGLGALVSSGI